MTAIDWDKFPAHYFDRNMNRSPLDPAMFVDELREHPGKWCLYGELPRRGPAVKSLKFLEAETGTWQREDGLYNIFARWPKAWTDEELMTLRKAGKKS